MNTPIADFISRYEQSGALRLHMPGHKGHGSIERYDLTEIFGADSLFEPSGIIAESEQNASSVFGFPTLYSTEGASHCIRAMLYLAVKGIAAPYVLAGRNAHKAFLSAAALLDLEIGWLTGDREGYLSSNITAAEVENALKTGKKPAAVYLTSPDYLGNLLDVRSIADVCKKYGVPLLIDNAHGAYLKFLPESMHPIDLGADMCASSAHKTLPVLTGGAYLQFSDERFLPHAKEALALFGSTSPSYLTLSSLDKANDLLDGGFPASLRAFLPVVETARRRLQSLGFSLVGQEPLKITLAAKAYGYLGTEIAEFLRAKGIECEFADPDYIVFMLSPLLEETGLIRLLRALEMLPKKPMNSTMPPACKPKERALSVREAAFARSERVPVKEALGKVLSSPGVSCPPAVPILVCGERIDEDALQAFSYYGYEYCEVVKE